MDYVVLICSMVWDTVHFSVYDHTEYYKSIAVVKKFKIAGFFQVLLIQEFIEIFEGWNMWVIFSFCTEEMYRMLKQRGEWKRGDAYGGFRSSRGLLES